MEIGTLLRKLREQRRISTREIADRLDIAQSTYLAWEHEKTYPSLKLYFKLAESLEICPLELMAYFLGRDYEAIKQDESLRFIVSRDMVRFYKEYTDMLRVDSEAGLIEKKPGAVITTSSSSIDGTEE